MSFSKVGFVIWTKKIILLCLISLIIHTNYVVIFCNVYNYYKVSQDFLKVLLLPKGIYLRKYLEWYRITKVCSWKHPQRWHIQWSPTFSPLERTSRMIMFVLQNTLMSILRAKKCQSVLLGSHTYRTIGFFFLLISTSYTFFLLKTYP